MHDHFMAHLAHRPQGVFTRLSGEVREELRGVCAHTQLFTGKFPVFLFFFNNPSLLFVVFPIMPIRDNILLTDVTENLHLVIARNSFTIQHCVEQEPQTTKAVIWK